MMVAGSQDDQCAGRVIRSRRYWGVNGVSRSANQRSERKRASTVGSTFPDQPLPAYMRDALPVVALVGDGGFAHSWAELETRVRLEIPLTIIVLNNGILGYQKDAETMRFGRYTTACHFGEVDHAAIARACGCQGVRVEAAGDIGPVIDQALIARKSTLIEVMTDPLADLALHRNAGRSNATSHSRSGRRTSQCMTETGTCRTLTRPGASAYC